VLASLVIPSAALAAELTSAPLSHPAGFRRSSATW
jgi:hypothetical protein